MARKNISIWLLLAATLAFPGAGLGQNSAVQEATTLYTQHKYAAAADAFERAMKSAPSARVCYYAALSNQAAGKATRAKQLFQYVANTYRGTAEASYAQQALSKYATSSSQSDPDDLPDSVKNSMPPQMRALLNTPMGRKAVMQILHDRGSEIATIREAENRGLMDPNKVGAAVHAAGVVDNRAHGDKDHPFTAADIARDGADGIDQTRYPNCWFESSMAALAQLPRGQRLIASMIRTRDDDTYVVRFPNDGKEYNVTHKDMLATGITDSAAWASIIECAQVQKFPDNKGAEGAYGDQSRLEVGLGCITGCKAEIIYPRECSAQQISSFIGGAVKSQNPIVAGTWDDNHFPGPVVVIPQHAYTIIGFDPSRNMVILRNPHGRRSRLFSLASDPKHQEFEQLDDGVCKLSIGLFQKLFYSAARSFI